MTWPRLLKVISVLTGVGTVVPAIFSLLYPPFPLVEFTARFFENNPESYKCIDSASHIAVDGHWKIRIENFSQIKSIRFEKISVVAFSREGGIVVHIEDRDSVQNLPKSELLFLPLKHVVLSAPDMVLEQQNGSLPYISRQSAAFIKLSKGCALPYSWKNFLLESGVKNPQPDTLTFNITLENKKSVFLSAVYDKQKEAWVVNPRLRSGSTNLNS